MPRTTWAGVVVWAMLGTACDIALARLSFGLLLPAIRTDLPGNYALYGLVTSLHLAGYLAGTLIAPATVRRLGGTGRTVLVGHVFVALTLGVSAFSSTVLALTIARITIGVATGVGMVALIAGGLERIPVDRRLFGSGLIWGGAALGLVASAAAAPALLEIHGGWRDGTLAIAVVTLVVAIGAGITYLRTPEQTAGAITAERAFAPSDLATSRFFFLILAYAGFGTAYIAYATFVVSALHAQGATSTTIAWLWGIFGIAGFFGAIAVRLIVTGKFARLGLFFALSLATLGCVIGSAPGLAMAFLGSGAVGLGLTATPAIASYQARARSSAATGAQALAAVTACFGIGQIVGPILAGAVADRFGPHAISVFAASVFALSAGAAAIDANVVRQSS